MYFSNIDLVCTVIAKLPQFSKFCIKQNRKSAKKDSQMHVIVKHPESLDCPQQHLSPFPTRDSYRGDFVTS